MRASTTQQTIQLIQERRAYWAGKGLSERDVLLQLASDPALPLMLLPGTVAALEGVQTEALKMRRIRENAPIFVRFNASTVRYPTQSYFLDLASKIVEPKVTAAE